MKRLVPSRSVAGALLATLVVLSPGCGLGVGVAVSGAQDDEAGDTDQATVISDLSSVSSKSSPARIRFRLTDPDPGDVADLEIRYSLDGNVGTSRLITHLSGLATSAAPGVAHEFEWDFAAEFGSQRFQALTLFVLAPGTTSATPGQNTLATSVGNDPPVLSLDAGQFSADEISSTVPVNFSVADVASEETRIRVEFNSTPGFPESGWTVARPSGLSLAAPTPEFAFDPTTALELGTNLTFAWDSNFDLGGRDVGAKLRLVAVEVAEPSAASAPAETPELRIDNNLPPSVQLDIAGLLLNDDGQRALPIALDIDDPEDDSVEVLLQWRRQGHVYPDLPQDRDGLAAVLADPLLRRRAQIASEQPVAFSGRLVPTADPAVARLPDMAFGTIQLATRRGTPQASLIGRELEVLRVSRIPRAVSDSWSQPALDRPVAVLGLASGESVLVLEPSGDDWRVRELATATGAALGSETMGQGRPTAMAWLEPGRSFLVASTRAGDWSVFRVELRSRVAALFHENAGRVTPGRIRGLSALGASSFAACVADAVVSVQRSSDGAVHATLVMDSSRGPLVEPTAIVQSPGDDGRVFVADRGRERIFELDLHSHAIQPFPGADFLVPGTRALALEMPGNRLLVLADEPGGGARILSLSLRRNPDVDEDGRSEPELVELAAGLPAMTNLAVAADGFLALADGIGNRLFAAGGVEQVREIVAYEPARQEARVAAPFEPPLGPGRTWRIRDHVNPVPPGGRATFVWDTRDVFGGGSVLVRAFAFDRDRGQVSTEAPKLVSPPAGSPGSSVAGTAPDLVFADIDQDGDVDELDPQPPGTNVRRQTQPGEYGPSHVLLDSDVVVQVIDIDGDGRVDLLGRDSVFFQSTTAPGTFARTMTLEGRIGLAAGDMDGDGLVDLIVGGSEEWFLLRQGPSGVFTAVFSDSVGNPFRPPDAVFLADLDLDGLLDLVLRQDPHLGVSLQAAPGLPGPTRVIADEGQSCFFNPRGFVDVRLVDLSQDGMLDLVATSERAPCSDKGVFGSQVLVFHDPGLVGRSQFIGGASATPSPGVARTEDLNRDGVTELLVELTGSILVFEPRPDGLLEPSFFLEGFESLAELVPLGDPDGDGFRDPAHRLGTWVDSPEGPVGTGGVAGYSTLDALDANRDGLLDLRGGNFGISEVELMTQGPIGRFGPDTASLPGVPKDWGHQFLAADFSGDGIVDGASVGTAENGVYMLGCDGGRLGASCELASNSFVVAGDLDGDGDLDLLNPGQQFGTFPEGLHVFLNDGQRVEHALQLGDSNGSFLLADVDGDGDLDVVQATGPAFQFFLKGRTFEFQQQPMLGVAADGVSGALDLDRDGHLDFFLEQNGQTNLWSLRDPVLVFDGALSFRGGFVVDLDRDGLPDVLERGPAGLRVLLQTAPRIFVADPFASTSLIRDVIADLDGDGDLDGLHAVGNRIQVAFGGR